MPAQTLQTTQKTTNIILPSSNAFFITKEIYDEFESRRKKEFPDIKALNNLTYYSNTKEVEGSNPFIACYVNKILDENYRTATQSDLEEILRDNSLTLIGHYEDSALILRSEEDPNSYLAKHLMKQVKERLGKKLKLPLMIPLYGLEIEKDENSPYKLAFNLKENAELIHASILNKDSAYFKSKDIDEKTGLPRKLGQEDRHFYAIKDGLCRLYLSVGLLLDSSCGPLSDSGSGGGVVVIKTS